MKAIFLVFRLSFSLFFLDGATRGATYASRSDKTRRGIRQRRRDGSRKNEPSLTNRGEPGARYLNSCVLLFAGGDTCNREANDPKPKPSNPNPKPEPKNQNPKPFEGSTKVRQNLATGGACRLAILNPCSVFHEKLATLLYDRRARGTELRVVLVLVAFHLTT